MTVSPAEGFRAFVLAVVLVAMVAVGLPAASFAQTGDQPVTAPPRTLGAPTTDETPPSDGTSVIGQGDNAVTVAPLGASEGPAVGLIDETGGGFASDIWSGMDRAAAVELLSRLPVTSQVPSLRALAHRLLVTKADSPPGTSEHSFLTIRLRELLASGFIDDAGALAVQAEVKDDPEFARQQADAILLANRAGDACGEATATRLADSDPFWIELRAYCYAVGGNGGLLDLTRSVMDAQGISDPAFDTLLDDVISKATKDPGDIANPTSLHIFLLRQAGLAVRPDVAHALGGAAVLIAMRDTKNAPNERLAAAEGAIFSGAVTSDELAGLADAAAFSPEQLAHALDDAPGMTFLKSQALLRRAALHESDESRKVQLVFQALQLGEKTNLLSVAAALQHAPAASIKPIRAMRPMAELIGRALLLAGDADAASHWCDILDPKAPGDVALIARFRAELNLIATNPARAKDAQAALTYLAAQMPQPAAPALTADQALDALTLSIYSANGEPMPAQVRAVAGAAQAIQWPGRRPAPMVMQHLNKVLDERGHKGDALLTILDAVGDGPGDLAPDVTLRLSTALIETGLADTARAFAIDALLLKPAP